MKFKRGIEMCVFYSPSQDILYTYLIANEEVLNWFIKTTGLEYIGEL